VLPRRSHRLGSSHETHLTLCHPYPHLGGTSPLRDLLVRIGLGGESDVKPASVTAWAGVEVFERTGRIEQAARRLGLRSLDRAATVIGHTWRPTPGLGPGSGSGPDGGSVREERECGA
ncbi:hypothetical protein, partial [Streptomyces sp. NPDC014744]|uniref:hypothetical protein n=1 Tax=Streptomyces sp. NPDC014744 TaxID=3364903 RepID=UPI0036F866D0